MKENFIIIQYKGRETKSCLKGEPFEAKKEAASVETASSIFHLVLFILIQCGQNKLLR